jgi:probable rRNA maturation factor
MTVEIVDATGNLSAADAAWLHEHAKRAGGLLGLSGTVSARVVGDEEMAEVHTEFCGVEGTTDVITFDLTDPEDGMAAKGVVEADLLLCYDEAERQAKARGHEARRELLLYIVHGVLHCIGHDDHDEAGYAKMHAEEDRLLGTLGVGTTFASDQTPKGGDR